jgi:heavy metal sensor kinase
MNRLRGSVRLRLTLWYGGVLTLVLAVFAVAVYLFVVRTLQTPIDETLYKIAARAASGQQQQRGVHVNGVRDPLFSQRDPVSALLSLNNISPNAARRRPKLPSRGYQQMKIAFQSGHQGCFTMVVQRTKAGRKTLQRACIKLNYDKSGLPYKGVEVIESLAGVDRTLERLRLALLLGLPFTLLLAGLGGWVLAGRALEPVDRITQMARSISASDLSRRINLRRRDELGRLASTFDEMIDRLERAFHEQRQLTADVSHELRSPLTILEAQTTLALRRSRSPDEYRHVLSSVQEEVERMSEMVNQLLLLARAEAGEEELKHDPLDLRRVAEPVVDAMQPVAREQGVRLSLRAGPARVRGDAARIRQLLLNLLNNAMQHTPPGGQIVVTVEPRPGAVALVVTDSGEGIPEEDLSHIFQRFYRGDRARRRGTGNSGLGLAIVKWIAEAHGGQVTASSNPGHGATFTVILPADTRAERADLLVAAGE